MRVGSTTTFDTTAARLIDPRFRGIERVDLRATYGAPLDGASHPMTQAAALIAYPNCGATGTIEQDTAAWLQAEYDLRTGPGGIISLPDGALMQLSAQLWLQNAAKVWFHGGRGCYLMAAGVGSVPAVRVSHADQLRNSLPLRDLYLMAKSSTVYVPNNLGGVAHSNYVPGSKAIAIDNCQNAIFERIGWNGFDQPIVWGDNTFCVTFRVWIASGNNVGLNWSQTVGLNSMERMTFEDGISGNNNYGVQWIAIFGTSSQAGSVFLKSNSIDYNVVRQVSYQGSGTDPTMCVNAMHLIGNHIETSGACSGTTLARSFTQGSLFGSHNEFYEADSNLPPGLFEIADRTGGSINKSRIQANGLPIFYSSTKNPKIVSGQGNAYTDVTVRTVLMRDGNGYLMQSSGLPTQTLQMGSDNGILLAHQGFVIYCNMGTLTVLPDSTVNHAIGTTFWVSSAYSGGTTITAGSGVSVAPFGQSLVVPQGQRVMLEKVDVNLWALIH